MYENHELPKTYSPAEFEDRIYQNWCEKGYFTPDPNSTAPSFSVVIPPPNVTGILTLGHVLNNTLQDILCRRARMKGLLRILNAAMSICTGSIKHCACATGLKMKNSASGQMTSSF